MPAEVVFVDSVALIALANQDDALHLDATRVSRSLAMDRRPLITTDWVLTEFLGSASKRPLRSAATTIVGWLMASQRTTILPAAHEDWVRGYELYMARRDKEWSLVDCISILACEARSIRQVFTHDHHFEQAGLEILL